MSIRCRTFAALACFFCLAFVSVQAGEPFRFPEARHGKGELKYRNGIPVLTVEGTPQEIGEQVATLVGKPSRRLLDYPKEVLTALAGPTTTKVLWPIVVKKCGKLLENFPTDYRQEFEAMQRTSGFDREIMTIGNTIFDLKADLGKLFGCSALIIEADRSATGNPIFGRNMDYISLGYLHEYSLVTVFRPVGKHSFAAVGYPGFVGCLSGINDAGLSLTVLETTGAPPEEGPVFNIEGVPFALCYRRLLEECTTIKEAEALLKKMKRTTTNNLALCDKNESAVFEITSSRVIVRRAEKSISVCTNHFCTDKLKLAKPKNLYTTLDRFATLEKARGLEKKLGIEDVQHYLDAANQGELTLQTMIFEPSTLTLHLAVALGKQPASSQKLNRLELGPLFDSPRAER